MPTPAELAQSHTDLKPDELGHLQRLLGSWSVLADLSFSDLLLLVPVHSAGADETNGRAARPRYPCRTEAPAAPSTARRSSARSATCSSRCASDAVVSGTARATNRSSSPAAGYCSAIGARKPADDTSAAMPDAAAASAIRSHHSAGAAGTWPAILMRSGCARTSHAPEAASSSIAVV